MPSLSVATRTLALRDSGSQGGALTDEKTHDEERFYDTFMVLYDSYKRGRGRTLDPEQVKVLVNAFHEISEGLNEAITEVAALEVENADLKEQLTNKEKIWTP